MKHYLSNNFSIETYGQAHLVDSEEADAILARGQAQLKSELKAGAVKAEALPRIAREVYAQWRDLCYRGHISKMSHDQICQYEEMIAASDGEDGPYFSLGEDLNFSMKFAVEDWYEYHEEFNKEDPDGKETP